MQKWAFFIIWFWILILLFPDLIWILVGGFFVIIWINILIASWIMNKKNWNTNTSNNSWNNKKEYKFLNYTIYKDE